MQKQKVLRMGATAAILLSVLLALILTNFFASAQEIRIQYGETAEGEIINATNRDNWRFEGMRGDVVTVRVERTGGDLIPSVTLIAPDETVLVSLDWPQEGPPAVIFTVSFQTSGPHQVIIQGIANTTGTYAINLELVEESSEQTIPGMVVYGRTVSGEITNATFREFWTFYGRQNDVIDASMVATSGDLDTYLSLVTPQGEVLAFSDGGSIGSDAALFVVKLPSTGIYTLATRRTGANFGEAGASQGQYDLTVTLRLSGTEALTQTPVTLTLGNSIRGKLNPDAPTALYSIETRGVLTFALDLINSAQIGTVTIMTPDRALLGEFSGPTPLKSNVTLPQHGPVLIEVSAPNLREDIPMDFELMVAHLETAERASKALQYRRPRVVAAASVPQKAWHFAGQADDLVEITLIPHRPIIDGVLQIMAPDGTLLVQRTIHNGVIQNLLLRESGQYEILLVSETPVFDTGYQIGIKQRGILGLSFEQHPVPQEQGNLLPGDDNAVSGTVAANSSDAWTITISEMQTWHFELLQAKIDTPIVLIIEAPGGDRLAVDITKQLTNSASVHVLMSHPGRYRAIVWMPSEEASQTYTLQGKLVEGGVLTLNKPAKGVLTENERSDRWTIDVPPGGFLNIQVDVLNENRPPTLHVVGPDGLLLHSTTQDDWQNAKNKIGVPISEGGQLQIIVVHSSGEERIVYNIEADLTMPFDSDATSHLTAETSVDEVFVIAPTPTPIAERVTLASQITPIVKPGADVLTEAKLIETDILIRGEIQPGALYQAWHFSADEEQMLGISVVALDDSSGSGIMLLADDHTILTEKFVVNTTTNYLMYRIPDAGQYTVIVKLNQGGRYTLNIDPLSDIDERIPNILPGQTIAYGDTLFDEITQPDDERTFVFYGHTGDNIVARAAPLFNQDELLLKLTLSSANGDVLEESQTDADNNTLTAVVPAQGIYQIAITRADRKTVTRNYFALHLALQETTAVEQDSGILKDQHIAGLSITDAEHQWLFAAQSGEHVTIWVEPLMSGAPTPFELKLTDSAGNAFLRKAANIGQGTLQFTNVLLPRTGIYQAVVSGGDQQPGIYRISLERQPVGLQNEDRAVRYGETVGKVLTQDNFLDVWTFSGSQGNIVTIAARPVRGDTTAIALQVRDHTGQILDTAIDDGTSSGTRIEHVTLPRDGHYVVLVGNPDGTFTGETAYELVIHLEDTTVRSMGTMMTYEQTMIGSFFIDDATDVWLFEGKQGDVITARVTGTAPHLTPALTLVTTDWRITNPGEQAGILASAQSVENDTEQSQVAQIEYVLPNNGAYALIVQDATRAGGDYRISLTEHRENIFPTNALNPNQEQQGKIGLTTAVNSWIFDGVSGDIVTLMVTPFSKSTLIAKITLLAPDGTLLVSRDALPGKPVQIEDYSLATSGQYTVLVTQVLGENGRGTGRYTIALQQTPRPTLAYSPVVYGQPQRGTLDGHTPKERWILTGQQGDVIHISAEATSGDLDVALRLYDENGTLLAQADDGHNLNAALGFTLPANGAYEIEAARYGGTQGITQGNYVLLVENRGMFESTPMERVLAYGDRVIGTTESQRRSDYWVFNGEQGDVIAVKIQFPRDDAPLLLFLRDPAGNALITGQRDRGDSIIDRFVLPTRGYYTLEVHRPGDAQTVYSPYTLDLELTGTARISPTQGGVLVVGEITAGRFIEIPATHTWFFQGNAGNVLSLVLQRLDGPLAIQVTLLAPDGTTVLTTQTQPGSTTILSTGPLQLPLDGLYTLLIASNGTIPGTTYRLSLHPVDTFETAGQELSPLQDGFGTLNNVRPQERWRFEAQAGDTLFLRVGTTVGNLKPTLMLWGADGQLLATGHYEHTANGLQVSLSQVVVPSSGVYHVIIGREGGAAGHTTGNYRLMLRKTRISSQAASAIDVPFGIQQNGFVQGSHAQFYAFQGLAGDVTALSVRVTDTGPIPVLSIEAEDGTAFDAPITTTQNEASVSALILPADGRYIVKVQGKKATSYVLSVFRRAQEIPQGGLIRNMGRNQTHLEGVLSPARPTYWEFSGRAGEVLTFTVNTTGGGLRADVTLYGPAGYIDNVVEQPDSNAQAILGPIRLPEDGKYILLVGPWLGELGGSTGQYSLHAEIAEPSVSGSEGGHLTAREQVVTGGLILEDAQDKWTFDGQAGEKITVRAEQTHGDGTLELQLMTNDGATLATSQPTTAYRGAEIIELVLPATIRYSIVVDGTLDEETAIEYRLAILSIQNSVSASMDEAQGITYGEQQTDAFVTGDFYQAWVFFGHGGEHIRGTVTPHDATLTPVLYLVGPDGTILLAKPRQLPGEKVQLSSSSLPEDGFYGLVVGHESENDANGGYTIKLERLTNSRALAQGVLDDQARGKLFDTFPIHEWTLAPTHPGDYLVEVVPLTPDMKPNVWVVAPDGTLITGEKVDNGIILRLDGAQLYTAVVSGGPAAQGHYSIRFLPASTVTGNDKAELMNSNVGRIDTRHLIDEWHIQGLSNGELVIEVARMNGNLEPLVTVFDVNGNLLKQETAGVDGTLMLVVQTPEQGRYSVLVSRAGAALGHTSGDYAISVQGGE